VGELRRLLFEVLPPGWHIVEQIPHLDSRPFGTAGRRDVRDLATFHDQFGPAVPAPGTGRDCQPRDRADCVERLATEAERRNPALQVVDVADLAGGVFLDGAREVLLAHPHAVVGDPDAFRAAGLDCDADPGGVGVDAVFDQFLDNGGGPLDDLAGRDPLDCPGIQLLDLRLLGLGHSRFGVGRGPS